MNNTPRKIDFTFLATKLWLGKYIIICCVALGAIAGYFKIKWTPREYSAAMTMMPEDGKGNSGTSQLAAMMGVYTSGNGSDAYSPTIYPDIVSSIPFLTGLFDVEVQTSANDSTYTLRAYLEQKTQYPWWNRPSADDDDASEPTKGEGEIVDPFHLTHEEMRIVGMLRRRVWASLDNKTGEIAIGVMMQDPLVAAQLTDTVAARLQEYIVDYRTSKARRDLDYAIAINEDAKVQYYEAQSNYAEYMDANQGLALYSAQTTRDRLENEMQLAFNLYNQTSQRVQTAEAKVQEVTPVYAVVDPATVPLYASAPARMRTMVICIGTALMLGIVIVLAPTLFGNRFMQILRREKRRRQRRNERRRQRRDAEKAFAPTLIERLLRRRKHLPDADDTENADNDADDNDRFAPPVPDESYVLIEQEYVLPEDDDLAAEGKSSAPEAGKKDHDKRNKH